MVAACCCHRLDLSVRQSVRQAIGIAMDWLKCQPAPTNPHQTAEPRNVTVNPGNMANHQVCHTVHVDGTLCTLYNLYTRTGNSVLEQELVHTGTWWKVR